MKHPKIAFALMFGRRTHPGVLLELKKEYQFDPQDQTKLSEFRDAV